MFVAQNLFDPIFYFLFLGVGGWADYSLETLIIIQCLKLRFYLVHLRGAKTSHSMHMAICPCVAHYISLFKFWKNHAHTGCTGFKICAPCSQSVYTGCRVHP